MFQPYPADLMEMWQVLLMINSIGNDSAELVVPVGVANTLDLAMRQMC
jgi:putative SOS response-associated peptidase YedK